MANIVSGGNGGINLNTNISGPSGNYGRTIGVSSGPNPQTDPDMIVNNNKNTEELDFNSPMLDMQLQGVNSIRENGGDIDGFINLTNNMASKNNSMGSIDNVSTSAIADEDVDITDEDLEVISKEEIKKWTNIYETTLNDLKREKEDMEKKLYSFIYNLEYNPELRYDDVVAYPACLTPDALLSSSFEMELWLRENGYPTNPVYYKDFKHFLRNDYDQDVYNRHFQGVDAYKRYVNNVYSPIFDKHLKKYMGMTYEEYKERISEIDSEITYLDAAIYSSKQLIKQYPYIEIMATADYRYHFSKMNIDKEFDDIFSDGDRILNAPDLNYNYLHDMSSYLTDEEKAMICYLYMLDYEEPLKYIDVIKDTLNQRKGQAEAEAFINKITKNGKIDRTKLKEAWDQGTLDGLKTFFSGFSNILKNDGVISSEQYKQMFILQILDEKAPLEFEFLYKLGNGLGNMAPSMAVSLLSSPLLGVSLMGLSAGGNAKNQALISGQGELTSIIYGTLIGLSEATLQKFLGNIPALNPGAKFGLEILSEGYEELLQSYIDAGFRAVLFNEEVTLGELMTEGFESFIYGVALSGLTTGTSTLINVSINGVKTAVSTSGLSILNNIFKSNNIKLLKVEGNDIFVFESMNKVDQKLVANIKKEYPSSIIGVKSSDGEINILDTNNMTIRNDGNFEISLLKEKMIIGGNNLISIDPNKLNYKHDVLVSGEKLHLFKTETESIEYGVNVYETYYVLANDDGKYVGYVRGFSTRGKNAANNVTLEYEIDPSMQGKGYGTAMLSYITNDILSKGSLNGQDVPVVGIQGLQNTNIDTITLQISDNNIASQAIAEKNGFTKTGDMTYTITKEQYSSHVKEQQEKFRNNITNLGKGIYNTFSSVGKEIYNGIAPVGNMFYNMFTNVSNKIIGENSSAQNIPSLSTPKLVALLNECYNNRDIELLKKNVNVMTDTQINELLTYFKTNPSDMYLDVIESLTPEQFKFALDNNLLDIQNADGNIIISNDIFPLFLEYYYGSEYSIGMHGIDDRHLESGVNNATKIKESILNEGLCFKNYRSFLSTIMFGTDSMSNYLSAGVYDAGGVIVALPQVLKNSNGEEIYVGTPGDSVSDRNVGNGSLSEKAFADIYDENNNAINPMFILATYEKIDDGHVKITYNPNHISFNDGVIPNEYFEVIEGRINVNEGESSGDSFVNAGDLTADSDNNDVNNSQNTTIKYEAFDIDNIKSTYKLSDEVSFEIYDISVKYNVSNSEALIMYSLNLINSTRSVPIETVSEATAQIIAKNTQGYTDYGKQIWINNFNKLSNEQVQKFNEYITLITSLNYTLTINNPNDFGTIVLDSGEIVETDAYMKEETKKLLVELGFSSNSNIDIEEFVKNIFKVAPNLIDKKGTISSQELNEVIIDLVSNIFFIDNGVSNNLSDIEDIAIRLFGEDLEKIDIINNPENLKNFLQNLNNFEARVLYNYNESCILRNTNEILLAKDNWDNFDIDEKINFARNAYNARIYIRSNAQLMMIGSNSLPSTGTNPLMETFERAMIYRMTFNLIEFKKIINDIDCPKSILNVVNSLNITTNRMFADYFKNAVKNNKITIEDIEKLYYLLEENNEAQTLLSDAAYNLIKGTYRANETVNSTLGIYGEYIKKEN